jgi:hypothetical protein
MKEGIEQSQKMLNIAKERNTVKTAMDLSKLHCMHKQSPGRLLRN